MMSVEFGSAGSERWDGFKRGVGWPQGCRAYLSAFGLLTLGFEMSQ